MIDFDATLLKVRSEAPPLEDESDSQYAARTLHLAYMIVEHCIPVFKQEEKEDNE